jgi:hypothetical protein
MAILAGVDLVAKFYKGSDATGPGQVGTRFKAFIHDYFGLTSTAEKETIYQLRNSLLHSFGLYSQGRTQAYHFLLTAAGGGVRLVQNPRGDFYQVDLIVLHEHFEQALQRYATDLNNQTTLQDNFMRMFTNYGLIRIGQNI